MDQDDNNDDGDGDENRSHSIPNQGTRWSGPYIPRRVPQPSVPNLPSGHEQIKICEGIGQLIACASRAVWRSAEGYEEARGLMDATREMPRREGGGDGHLK